MVIRRLAAPLLVVAFLAVACGDTTTDSAGTTDAHGDATAPHHDETFNFGETATPDEAGRVVEVEASDDLEFLPARVEVSIDEVVTFRVTNTGKLPHDFTLGDAKLQEDHDAEMATMGAEMMAMHDEPNAFALPAGETKELTWRFDTAGSVIFGCHVPGHYAAGMRGEILVN